VRIHHLALRVADCARAAAFYSGVLGLPELRRREDGAALWLRAGDAILMLERSLRGVGPNAGSGHVLALEVHDLAAWETRLTQAGIAVVDRTDHTLYVQDPDGHRVGLSVFPPAA
jgi:catechol 2,3-dioxygenase-like lactoylglutathione lyase family enzyme